MQRLDFGQTMPGRKDQFLRVKQKGDTIKFRIAQPPVYTGKHFATVKDPTTGESKWDVTECPRINGGGECGICEKFFEAKAKAKKLKDEDPVASKNYENEARGYSVAIQFYFPILNRDTQEFGILQTTQGVRNKINEIAEVGVDIFEKDWVLRNTGSESPKDLYSIVAMDSKDTAKLTDKEDDELVRAQSFDMMSINEGQSTSDEGLE